MPDGDEIRILIVNPNTSSSVTQTVVESASRFKRLSTTLVGVEAPWGPESIESHYEGYLSAAAILQYLADLDDSFQAVVLAGYGEPGREGAREILDVPVVDITEASAHIAYLLGHRFGIVTTVERAIGQIEDSLRTAGLLSQCASIRATGLGVLDVDAADDEGLSRIIDTSRAMIEQDGAEVICLGCAAMAGLDKRLESDLGVPVVDGVVAAVKLAEALVDYGVKTSKIRAYAPPRATPTMLITEPR